MILPRTLEPYPYTLYRQEPEVSHLYRKVPRYLNPPWSSQDREHQGCLCDKDGWKVNIRLLLVDH